MQDIETRIAVHEAICAERYKKIEESLATGEKRMTKIEYLLYAVMACVLLGPGVAATIIHKLFGV
jgi:cell division protein FtsL